MTTTKYVNPYNGTVLCAFHSCGAFDPSGYASRSVELVKGLQFFGVNPHIVVRPGYPWNLPNHRSKARVSSVRYEGMEFQLCPESPVTLHTPVTEYIASYARWLEQNALEANVSVIYASSNYLNGYAAALAGHL